MQTTTQNPTNSNIISLVEQTFGHLPVQDIYSYKRVYLDSKNGIAENLRTKMITLYETGNYTQLEIARLFNASRKSVNKWINRNKILGSIEDESRAPDRRELKVTPFVKDWVKDLMTEFPFMGSRRISHMIGKRFDYKINHLSVSRIMKELTTKPKVTPKEIEIEKPDVIWHMDMTQMRIHKGRKQFIFGVMDACTRQIHYIMNYNTKSTKSAVDCLVWAIKKADSKPKELWIDNGRMFISKTFKEYVISRGIGLHYLDKGSPWQNGKIERLFRTVKWEWIQYRRYRTPVSLQNSLKEFRRWFNNAREIQKLGYKTPNQISKNFASD